MALRRFIYVFILPFLAFTLAATQCGATGNSREEQNAAYTIQRYAGNDHPGQTLINRIIKSFDEGILVSLDHRHHNSAQSQARERDHVPVCVVHQSKWHFSSASSLHFTPAIRDEIDSFIPIVQLLVFPKHWFW